MIQLHNSDFSVYIVTTCRWSPGTPPSLCIIYDYTTVEPHLLGSCGFKAVLSHTG